jgi:hypothetical protein
MEIGAYILVGSKTYDSLPILRTKLEYKNCLLDYERATNPEAVFYPLEI